MALSLRRSINGFSSRLRALFSLQEHTQLLPNGRLGSRMYTKAGSGSAADSGDIKISACKIFNSRQFGIRDSMIPSYSWTVLKILQGSGFRAYFVGGCVRDLILHRTPKDFDVVTTATLKQIKRKFRCCQIIGKRFPICRVQIKNSIVEVSSFETVALNTKSKEKFLSASMPIFRDTENIILWRNSMRRDFTVNGLFFNPIARKIYDFCNGMEDLRSLTLRTLLPAKLSFKQDCAIILRGLRIAARLGLMLSKDIETAIDSFIPDVICLSKGRLMMELNYMLSYGAALPSLFMLKRFGLLEVLLPFHAASLRDNAMGKPAQSSSMLVLFVTSCASGMKINANNAVLSSEPADIFLTETAIQYGQIGILRPTLCLYPVLIIFAYNRVSLLAFHMALLNHPQDAFVVWVFASVLYYGQWEEGVQFASRHAEQPIDFAPELSGSSSFDTAELAERVSELASLAQEYAAVLADADSMSEYPHIPSSGLVLFSKKVAKDVREIFQALANDVVSFRTKKQHFEIDYNLLGRGSLSETRFALGKIVLETMNDGVLDGERKTSGTGKDEKHNLRNERDLFMKKNQQPALSDLVAQERSKNNRNLSVKPLNHLLLKESTNQQQLKQGKGSSSKEETVSKKPRVLKVKRSHQIVKLASEVPNQNLSAVEDSVSQVSPKSLPQVAENSFAEHSIPKKRQNVLRSDSARKSKNKREKLSSSEVGAVKKANVKKQQAFAEANTNPLLSDIFR